MLLMRLSSDNANFMVGNDLSQKKMKTTPGSMLFSILYEDNFSKIFSIVIFLISYMAYSAITSSSFCRKAVHAVSSVP